MKFAAWMAYHLETREIVDDYIRRTAGLLAGHEFVVCESLEQINEEIKDVDVMLGWRILPETFARATKLRWIQFGSTGIDHTVFPELLASSVILTNLGGIHTIPVAEHVFAQMLALSRRLDAAMRLQMERRFDRAQIASTADELSGKTIGIVGLGRIGLNIARLAGAFGMRVVGTKRNVGGPLPNVDAVYPAEELDEVLRVADYLVLVLPLTQSTRALLGGREFGLMKRGARIINVARGAMIDHDALAEALASGHIAGAALDVFPQEPLPPESPVWSLPNVIITPHTGASTPRYAERAFEVFRHNLEAFLTGGEMINVYDRQRGY